MNNLLNTNLTSKLRAFILRISSPVEEIQDPAERLRSRFFALSFLTIAVLLLLQSVIFSFAFRDYERLIRIAGSIVTVFIAIFAYLSSLKGRYTTGLITLGGLGSILVFLVPIIDEQHSSLHTLYYLGVIMLFAVMFLKTSVTGLVFIIYICGLLIVTVAKPHAPIVETLIDPAIFLTIFTLASIIFNQLQRQIDQMHHDSVIDSEHRYKIISDLMSDYAFCSRVNADGSITLEWVTDSFEKVTGYSPEQLMNSPSQPILFHPEDQQRVPQDMQLVLQGQTIIREYRILTKTGQERWIQMYRRPEWDDQQQRVVRYYGVSKDITDQKLASEHVLKFTLQQEQLNLINNLVNAISHDFRTSLTAIESSRYLVERKLSDEARIPVQSKLEGIQNHVIRLSEQLDHMSEISFLTNPNPKPCNLNAVVQFILRERTQISKAKKQEIIFIADETIPNGLIDENAITSVVTHLITNAANFTPEEGKITICTEASNGEIRLRVQDTGIGIRPENQENIFDLFYREDPGRGTYTGGVGIGLSIVKMVTEAHGGSISVKSIPGEGSAFTLVLPAVPDDIQHMFNPNGL